MHRPIFVGEASLLAVAGLALTLTSCGLDNSLTTRGRLHFDVVSGDQQSGDVGTQLAQPLVVKVTDPTGAPVYQQVLNFRVVGVLAPSVAC